MKSYTAEYFTQNLSMIPHIEGGYYKRVYESDQQLSDEKILKVYDGKRALATTIYFLLTSQQVSKFHKLKSDEIWFYHYGSPLIIHMIDEKGVYTQAKLGLDFQSGEQPQLTVPANIIFGAETVEKETFSFVSCMVTPGFDFQDFKLFSKDELFKMYPKHEKIICKLNGALSED